MKKIYLASIGAFMPALAEAHTSILPHDHPHATTLLPDLGVLLMAAVAVGAGVLLVARWKGAQK